MLKTDPTSCNKVSPFRMDILVLRRHLTPEETALNCQVSIDLVRKILAESPKIDINRKYLSWRVEVIKTPLEKEDYNPGCSFFRKTLPKLCNFLCCRPSEEKKVAPLSPPVSDFSVTRPLGLNNRGQNCWLNSILQMILFSDELTSCIQYQALRFPNLNKAINIYKLAQNFPQNIAPVNSQRIRIELSEVIKGRISPDINVQQDASEAMEALLKELPPEFVQNSPLYTLKESRVSGQIQSDNGILPYTSAPSFETTNEIRISLKENLNNSFQDALKNAFVEKVDVRSDEGQEVQNAYKNYSYSTHPKQFFLNVNRYYHREVLLSSGKTKMLSLKIEEPIMVPEEMTLPKEVLPSDGEPRQYQLKSFIVHQGTSPHRGHYFAFVREKQGLWWICDDTYVAPVKQSVVNEARQYAYSYYFDS